MERKDILKGRLRAIQELKEENYCGTSQAWGFVREIGSYYDNVAKIVKDLNACLGKETPNYPATPERIVGVMDTAVYLIHSAHHIHERRFRESKGPEVSENKMKGYIERYPDWTPIHKSILKNPIMYWESILRDAPTHYGLNLEALSDFLKQPIQRTNEALKWFKERRDLKKTADVGWLGNKVFGLITLTYMFNQEDRANELQSILNSLLTKKPELPWQKCLSVDNLREIERRLKREGLSLIMGYSNQFARMERDCVLKRFDYRRQILRGYIEQSGIESFDELKEALSFSFDEDYEKNVPPEIQELNRFLLRTFHQEENFLRRFLRG